MDIVEGPGKRFRLQSIGAIFDDGVDASLETDSHDFALQYWNFDSLRFEHSGLSRPSLRGKEWPQKGAEKRTPKMNAKGVQRQSLDPGCCQN